MALKDALARINNALKDTFHSKAYDPTDGRKKVVRLINNASKQHEEGKTRVPNRAWVVGFDSVSFKLVLNGQPILLEGEETVYLPPEEFQPFLNDLRDAVEAGELDSEIEAALKHEGGKTGTETITVTRKRAPSSTAGLTRPARSPVSNLRSSVGRSLSNGRSLDEIAAALKAAGKYEAKDIDAVIAEKRAAQGA
jgi:hypothetical protein